MKTIALTLLFIVLTNCSTHSVKLGKKCTKLAKDNTYEKSLIWLIDKKNLTIWQLRHFKSNAVGS